jgi:hypothetical protein
MGRPERPLPARQAPQRELAAALRALRVAAGSPSYRQLAAVAHYSAATLARAAAGHQVPSRNVAIAYATACGGDRHDWDRRWREANLASRMGNAAATAQGGRQVPAPSLAVPASHGEIGASRSAAVELSSRATARALQPQQLPADVAGFTGRQNYLTQLDALAVAPDPDNSPGTLLIAAIHGMAGVGKTTLAVHWARSVASQFPDGQLFVDLRGYAPGPQAQPAHVLGGFLRALGMRPEHVPSDVDEAAATFRSMTARRRLLLVLDDAASPEQVRPLLPGSLGCSVIVTSRDRLDGLAISYSVHRFDLGVLSPSPLCQDQVRHQGQQLLVELEG